MAEEVTKMANEKKIILPLFDRVDDIYHNTAFEDVDLQVEYPRYIEQNLVHTMRDYQVEALQYFGTALKLGTMENRSVLFNMATGSGKTDLMAGLILFLFKERKLQNFLFLVNTKAILDKTIENLTNPSSIKYLFKDEISINGRVTIKKVDNFPYQPDKNTIYIRLTTVQTLLNELETSNENTIGIKFYEKKPLVILGDEAHHFNSDTKKNDESENSWESAINRVLNANRNNMLLEFTATIDLKNKYLYNKYKNKIIYRYALDRFMADKYSKNVKRIETINDDRSNMLNAVLLSQYRSYRAYDLGIKQFKPVIMFKSQWKKINEKAYSMFNQLISELTSQQLLDFVIQQNEVNKENSQTLEMAYKFYLENRNNISAYVSDIKREFGRKNVINVNDSENKRAKAMLEYDYGTALNTLEDPNNFYRAVFAVAKLTEGWDVLNLFDIVRISQIEKSAKGDVNSTNSEAQLIGRGARYYPFMDKDGRKSYQRRLTDDTRDSLILETVHYHTLREPQYLKNLRESLKQLNLPTGEDTKNPLHEIKVSSSFKKTDLWKNGKIYYNKSEEVPDSVYQSLKDYGINHQLRIARSFIKATAEAKIDDEVTYSSTKKIEFNPNDERIFKKVFARNKDYHFVNLKRKLPNLSSMNDFMFSKNWLHIDNLIIELEVPKSFDEEELTAMDKFLIIENLLEEYMLQITKGYQKEKGTGKFVGYPIKDYVINYRKRLPNIDTSKAFSQNVHLYDEPKNWDWFAYDRTIVNNTEWSFIKMIERHVDELKEKYNTGVYLVRMDENMHRESPKGNVVKLHQFGDRKREDGTYAPAMLIGFQPDFLLLLQNEDFYFQIFIEPKGGNEKKMQADQWKEDLLTYINTHESEIEFEDEVDNVSIKGLKFYTSGDGRRIEAQLAQISLGEVQFENMTSLGSADVENFEQARRNFIEDKVEKYARGGFSYEEMEEVIGEQLEQFAFTAIEYLNYIS